MLLCPPVGWLLALGYRREVALNLVDGRTPVLPAWRGLHLPALGHGLRALIVILAYFAPLLTLYWALALGSLGEAVARWREVGLFFLCLPLFVPVTMPGLLVAYPAWHPWMGFSGAEVAVLAAAFAGTTFLLPAAFMQVSLHRRFRAALRVDRVVRLVALAPALYLEAWAISLVATALAGLSGPLMPWGIVWSYLVIGFAFNNALVLSSRPGVEGQFRESVLLHPTVAASPNHPLHLTAAQSGGRR
jgi:hypothetical protein